MVKSSQFVTSQSCHKNVITGITIVCRWPKHDLQRALYTLNNTTNLFRIKISPLNSKVMAYERYVPMRNKTVTENTRREQVN
jgi:hypothetical protein